MWNGPLWRLCYGRPHLIVLQVNFPMSENAGENCQVLIYSDGNDSIGVQGEGPNPRSASRNQQKPLPYLESISLLRSFILGFPHPFTVRLSINCIAVTHCTGKCCFTTVQFLSVSTQEEHAPGVQSLKSRTRFWFGLYNHGCKSTVQKAEAQSRGTRQKLKAEAQFHLYFIKEKDPEREEAGPQHTG